METIEEINSLINKGAINNFIFAGFEEDRTQVRIANVNLNYIERQFLIAELQMDLTVDTVKVNLEEG